MKKCLTLSSTMALVPSMRQFVCDRLTAAAQEILGVFEKKLENYEAEIARQRRLLDSVFTPEIKLHRTGWDNKCLFPNKASSVLNSRRYCSSHVLVFSSVEPQLTDKPV